SSMLDGLGLEEDSAEVESAKAAFDEFSGWLSAELQPSSANEDAVGRERYARFSKLFVGDSVDLDEAYEWGLHRLQEINAEQLQLAEELYGPGTSLRTAVRKLNADERYQLHGTDALVEWMQGGADKVISDLNGTYFDITEQIQTIQYKIYTAVTGGIFYAHPTEAFCRPGRMWWSVPSGQEIFHA